MHAEIQPANHVEQDAENRTTSIAKRIAFRTVARRVSKGSEGLKDRVYRLSAGGVVGLPCRSRLLAPTSRFSLTGKSAIVGNGFFRSLTRSACDRDGLSSSARTIAFLSARSQMGRSGAFAHTTFAIHLPRCSIYARRCRTRAQFDHRKSARRHAARTARRPEHRKAATAHRQCRHPATATWGRAFVRSQRGIASPQPLSGAPSTTNQPNSLRKRPEQLSSTCFKGVQKCTP